MLQLELSCDAERNLDDIRDAVYSVCHDRFTFPPSSKPCRDLVVDLLPALSPSLSSPS